jgi:hypothetical protein
MICGVRCVKVNKYQLTREHFEFALHRLANFSHIIFVEDMEESFDKFAKAYGWQYNFGNSIHNQRLDPSLLSKRSQRHDTWDPYMTVLDDALYEFARRKYSNVPNDELLRMENFTNQALLDEYFRDGPSRECTNECCGVCSIW